MSNRRSKNARRAAYTRGPSRPVDPRRAPAAYQRGYQRGYGNQRRGLDPFAMGLIIVTTLAVVLVILFIALQGSNNTGAGSSNSAANSNSGSGSPTPNWTQTTVAFSTQTAPDILPRITIQEAKALYDGGNIKIVDVRLKNLYDQGHIKGAVNVPEAEVGSHIKDLPKQGNLVLYCDCPHDEESAGTAYTLKTAGYTNMRVLQGPQAYTLWKNSGYPTEP
jgi:rhodanese-related sulfurtransferase